MGEIRELDGQDFAPRNWHRLLIGQRREFAKALWMASIDDTWGVQRDDLAYAKVLDRLASLTEKVGVRDVLVAPVFERAAAIFDQAMYRNKGMVQADALRRYLWKNDYVERRVECHESLKVFEDGLEVILADELSSPGKALGLLCELAKGPAAVVGGEQAKRYATEGVVPDVILAALAMGAARRDLAMGRALEDPRCDPITTSEGLRRAGGVAEVMAGIVLDWEGDAVGLAVAARKVNG